MRVVLDRSKNKNVYRNKKIWKVVKTALILKMEPAKQPAVLINRPEFQVHVQIRVVMVFSDIYSGSYLAEIILYKQKPSSPRGEWFLHLSSRMDESSKNNILGLRIFFYLMLFYSVGVVCSLFENFFFLY
uniref:Uncharacterized protein n=1 Tax=Pyxicephalus adspersus TaxID=30357 RepID=A0AAV2ZRK1_PYXAD|nr:TPA: hypothetical protein GDO54_002662 [Pyxicephalus adspersus]